MMDLIELFHAATGVVCCVGAGGKKSTLYRLAREHPGRVALTATAHTERFPGAFSARSAVAEGAALEAAVASLSASGRVVAFAKPCDLPGRHAGVSFEELTRLRAIGGFECCLVKADGARQRLVKAPAEHEPAIPPQATTVIPVVSAHVLGRPLGGDIAHRPERLAAVAAVALGEPLAPLHLARLLASPDGSLRGVGAARVVPLINMVDDADIERQAIAVAEQALALTDAFDYVVLAAMRRAEPIVRVVRR